MDHAIAKLLILHARKSRAALVVLGLCALCAMASLAGAESETSNSGGSVLVAARRSLILGEGENLWDLFLKGGFCMWPIFLCWVAGMAFFFERFMAMNKRKHAPEGFDKDVVHVVDIRGVDAGLAVCLEKQCSLSRVLYAALLRYGTSRQEMEAAVKDEGGRLHYDLRRNGRYIGIMAYQAPLWGLLGTVQGLIVAFDQMAAGAGPDKTERLAFGVGLALLPTAFGLMAAIPLHLAYYHVKGKAEDIVREIEARSVDAIITLDRKARRSIRLIEDLEENLETKAMAAAKPTPDLDAEFDDSDLEKSIKTSVTTPAHMPVVTPPPVPPRGKSTTGAAEPVPHADVAQPPRQIAPPGPER